MPHSFPVSKLMTNPKQWPQLRGNADISSAIKILRIMSEDVKLEHGHSTPLVFDENYKLLGFVHLLDLLGSIRHLCDKSDVPCELDKAQRPVKEIVTAFSFSVAPDDTILKALDLMIEHGVSLAPVLEGDKFVGMVKLSDIFGTLAALLFDTDSPEERQKLFSEDRLL
jgi:CBS domain-containing protein